jgi:hypothetical protein
LTLAAIFGIGAVVIGAGSGDVGLCDLTRRRLSQRILWLAAITQLLLTLRA